MFNHCSSFTHSLPRGSGFRVYGLSSHPITTVLQQGMARRPSLRERQQVIASVIAMWFELMQQYMVLLSKLAVAQSLLESNRRADPTTIVLPLPREVYRVGFLHYATKTTDQMCVNMLRMRKHIFRKLCTVLQTEGGLQRSKNMDVNEMVAIFLVTIGHNIKNRKAQFLFQRSAETISRVFKLVLLSILKMESQLLAKPTPVPPNCTNKNWKYFQGALQTQTRRTMMQCRTTELTTNSMENLKPCTIFKSQVQRTR
ncbi:hypothetical protein LINPERHAP2_LOCUS19810 [Linum perenne]